MIMQTIPCETNNKTVSDVRVENNEMIYHNARLLLEIYSKVLWRLEESMEDLDTECFETDNKHLFDLIDSLIDVETKVNKYRFEQRMQSIEESKSLIEFVDRALNKLKKYPGNGDLYFQIISKLYVYNQNNKIYEEDLLEELHISRSTFYREKRKAITLFGVTLWGFDLNGILIRQKSETELRLI